MAVVSINKLNEVSGSERGTRLVIPYQVVLDDPNTSIDDIYAHPDLPLLGSSHPQIPYLFVFDRTPRQSQDSRLIMVIEVDYQQAIVDNDILDTVLGAAQPNLLEYPEQQNPIKSWRTSEVLRPERYHRCTTKQGQLRQNGSTIASIASGRLITNTALIPPEVPPQRRVFNRVFTLTRFEVNWSDSKADPYLGHVNQTTFKGKAPYTVMCTMMDAENKYVRTGGVLRELALVTYQFEYDRDGHWEDIPNVSTVVLDAGGAQVQLVDSNDTPIVNPVFLDEDGAQIPAASLPTAETYIRAFFYEEAEFNNLGL